MRRYMSTLGVTALGCTEQWVKSLACLQIPYGIIVLYRTDITGNLKTFYCIIRVPATVSVVFIMSMKLQNTVNYLTSLKDTWLSHDMS